MSSADPSTPSPRIVRLVLVTPDGGIVGALPPLPVAVPWWQDAESVVRAVRDRHGIDVTILRVLDTEGDGPGGGRVTYLAEVAAPVPATEPWDGALPDHPLRQSYARPGGPAEDIAWAMAVLKDRGIAATGRPQQVRTWNLSSLWRIPAAGQTVWLKAVPPFFAHEGRVIAALAGGPVPVLLGHDGGRILMAEIAGHDLYDATPDQRLAMVSLLVGLQHAWMERAKDIIDLGGWDWRGPALVSGIVDVIARTADALPREDVAMLERFGRGLATRLAAIDACGLGDTLVHGDFHSGNLRGEGLNLTLLDWGDSGIGNPLLDQAAFLERVPQDESAAVRDHWARLWREAIPGSDPARAATLLAPVAAARQAVIYRKFLDNIEPAERVYHRNDPALWLKRTAALVEAEAR